MLVDGEPVVIDFGIAQAPDSTRLTMTGMFMGTPGYLAPEVIEGKPSGPAADVHSWAATMAYAATGRPPFGTGQFEAIFYRIVHGQPELDTHAGAAAADRACGAGQGPEPAAVGCRPGRTWRPGLDAGGPGARTPAGAAQPAGRAVRPGHAAGAGPARGRRCAVGADGQPGRRWQCARSAAVRCPALVRARHQADRRPAQDNFADLLPPVRYDQPGRGRAGPGLPGGPGRRCSPPRPWPGRPHSWPRGQPAPAGPGQPGSAPAEPAMRQRRRPVHRRQAQPLPPGGCWCWPRWRRWSP